VAKPDPRLVVPVPGMSLTTEPGSRPWEQPPKYVKLSDVVNHYSVKLSDGETMATIMDAVSKNIPIYEIVQGIIKIGVLKGLHTVDAGVLVAPVVVEMIKSVAEINDVGYIVTTKDKKEMGRVDKGVAAAAIKEVVEASKSMPESEEEPEEKGFVAKRRKK